MKNICHFTSVYFNNIGNAFIDYGTEVALNEALPCDAQVVKLSQYPFFMSSMSKGMALKNSKVIRFFWDLAMSHFAKSLHDKAYSLIKSKEVFNLITLAKLDYLVIPGCVLTVPFFRIFGNVLKEIRNNGAEIIFLGSSGNFYTDYEINYVSTWLEELKPLAIMTRDSIAFKYYNEFSSLSYNGIDNAFFVNKLNIRKIKTYKDPFVVLNFDLKQNKHIEDELSKKFKNIIYTNHKPYPMADVKKLIDKGVMVSDTPLDYLFLYSNASEVHSDRVHACIPTLSFGNKCRLYSDSPRKSLFENANIKEVFETVVSINNLEIIQNNQIDYLAKVLLS